MTVIVYAMNGRKVVDLGDYNMLAEALRALTAEVKKRDLELDAELEALRAAVESVRELLK